MSERITITWRLARGKKRQSPLSSDRITSISVIDARHVGGSWQIVPAHRHELLHCIHEPGEREGLSRHFVACEKGLTNVGRGQYRLPFVLEYYVVAVALEAPPPLRNAIGQDEDLGVLRRLWAGTSSVSAKLGQLAPD